ncbi:putative succinate-semialdehyde dehydrogenase [Clavispora lusitaniae]|uniref:Succinate-semialdehyde dehydrogenase n=1 Tax=Clavispora lusitaniae TaxID=36911 RepID=A0ACD0WMB1_CLALS|nr:putative succinate-semialdehyde dehydrogenase [Clavispora lusitaniae]QFZ34332.1 putative succinate-semialdehyde dehydrogenase [Clavispora lusitaniae]QFZ40016.1 putative succinate-semialdehyde dehydrogenase [Clavispora lusitaniae]QFZ45698.1 putative succinate-semialdehyde dehydrogenase [Clavispora lusitaniae]QFZ51362.1 putative succinate-semialdehyde dehydrogenase [Clavispora lusitaniae]
MVHTFKNPDLFRPRPFINGDWLESKSTTTFKVLDPASEEVIDEVPDQTPQEIADAIQLTSDRFESYKSTSANERSRWLRNLYNLMMENLDDLAAMITLENGKCLTDAIGEVKYAASYFEWFAEEAKRNYGHTIQPSNHNNKVITYRQPVGPVGLLCPFNFPLAMGARKAAPALAVGCPCILKPDGQTPFSSLALAYLADKAGFPKGVFNVVTVSVESTPKCGLEFCESPLIKKISFTGSTPVGKLLMKQCSSTLKKLSMELGGNAPVIVFSDANLDLAVEQAVASKFRSLGQTCVCANKLYVQSKVYDEFVEKFAEKVRNFKIGNGFEEGVTHACLINTKAIEKVEDHVKDAVSKGAKVVVKGGRLPELGKHFYAPYVLKDIVPGMKVLEEETFGPLGAIAKFETKEEVIEECNKSRFGLAAYIFSESLNTVYTVSEALETGMVSVNTGIFTDCAMPFGGVKESGFGREGSLHGIDDYTVIKSITLGNVYS